MNKIAAVAVALSLSAAGQAFAGPPHAPTAHPPTHAEAPAAADVPSAPAAPDVPSAPVAADVPKNGFFMQDGNGALHYIRNGEHVASHPHGTKVAAEPIKTEINAK
jgi:glucose/arabinose dehydrogenase